MTEAAEHPAEPAQEPAPAPTVGRDPGAMRGWFNWRTAALLAVSAGLVAHALVFNFINDDAFISFRYADNLVRHGELVFNLGERVEGYTNFLWTIVMAGVLGLGLDPVPWSKGLGIACALGTIWVVARFSRRYGTGASSWDALPGLLLAAAPAYACWSTGGLETQLFTLFATLGWTAYLLEHTDDASAKGFPISGVWFALSALTRPEGMLFFGLTGLHRLLEMLFVDRTFKPKAQDWLWGLGFAAVFVPYFTWRFWYYGWPFPNTYYVKTGAKNFWAPGFRYFGSWALTHLLWAVPVIALFRRSLPGGRAGRRNGRLYTLVLMYVLAVSFHVIRVGGDFMALHRFLVPIMPPLAIVVAFGLRRIYERLRERGVGAIPLLVAALILVAPIGHHFMKVDQKAMEVGSDRGVDSIGWLNMFAEQTTAIGKWLGENAHEDTAIAITAAGIIPFYSRLYTVDILALNDEWVAHNVPAHGNRPGHTKSAPLSYLLKKEVDYMIYHPIISAHRPGRGAADRRTWRSRGYEWFTVKVPGLEPPWWGTWRKKDLQARE